MNATTENCPGPEGIQPPERLSMLAASVAHPQAAQTGITLDDRGQWALLVRVRPGTATPIPEIDAMASPFAVVYQEVGAPPVARPAYPARGE